jgi:hypothetical protein
MGFRYNTHLDIALEQTVFAEPVALSPQCHLRTTHSAFFWHSLDYFSGFFCIEYEVRTPAPCALPIFIQ